MKDKRIDWSFVYPDYLQTFKRVVGEVGYPPGVPYQARHSRPSTDLADDTRSPAEARARRAAEWMKLPARTRTGCQVVATQLEATFRNLCRGRRDVGIEV